MFEVKLLPEVSEMFESLIIIKKKDADLFVFFIFSLKTNAEASEMILRRVFETLCLPFSENNN
jgi:hypothetical protein